MASSVKACTNSRYRKTNIVIITILSLLSCFAGKCKREEKTLLLHNMDENADYDERSRAEQQSI